jgi:hypothetical protein
VDEHMAACAHAVPPLSAARLAELGKQFADSIPDEGFSVAALQGCEYSHVFRMWALISGPSDHHLLRYGSGFFHIRLCGAWRDCDAC